MWSKSSIQRRKQKSGSKRGTTKLSHPFQIRKSKKASREEVLEKLEEAGGKRPGVATTVQRQTLVPEADIYGVATFYSLLAEPGAGIRVCQGLTCNLDDSAALMEELKAAGQEAVFASCLGRCDQAPAFWDPDDESQIDRAHCSPSSPDLAIDLEASDSPDYEVLRKAAEKGPAWVLGELEASGLTGRGGAGFPAHIKWQAIRNQAETDRYVVLNADEGEPGTFKDREVILRRPHLVIEGLAIAAQCLEAKNIYAYVRGEFGRVRTALEDASSVAGLLITTEAMVADKPAKEGAGAGGGMPDMGGMGGMM